jgi:SHS2 domain-containing protein
MKPSHKFIDHTADVLFEARADNLNELFEQCAIAVQDTQVIIKNVEPKETRTITGEDKSVENLLFDFLDDLLFYKDSEQLIFSKFKIEIKQENDLYKLTCQASGEEINVEKHQPKVDVKAITMHLFEVTQIKDGWFAKVLVDI